MKYTHVAFADETSYTGSERFGAISLVTMQRRIGLDFNNELKKILKDNQTTDLKWKKIGKDNKYSSATIAFLQKTISYAHSNKIRIDVVMFDFHDSRHTVKRRDNIANFKRMIHHLLKNTLTSRWPNNLTWGFFPDQNTSVRWDEVHYFLELKSILTNSQQYDILNDNTFKKAYNIILIKEMNSEKCSIVQLADLFAGLAVFSRK